MKCDKFMRAAGASVCFGILFALSACGGSGGSGSAEEPPPPAATPLPASLAITAVAAADLTETLSFSSNAANLAGLSFRWEFGDGSNSTLAAPTHRFARAGEFEVSLRVSNAAGQVSETKRAVIINNLAAVRGLECSGADDGGWCWKWPLPSGHASTSITFVNARTGWRVAAFGEIYKTTDAGHTWVRQRSGTNEDLWEVRFSDENSGLVRGSNGLMLATLDGGANWTVSPAPRVAQDHNRQELLRSPTANVFYLTDPSTQPWSLHFTEDGGRTWALSALNNPVRLSSGAYAGIQDCQVRHTTSLSHPGVSVQDLRLTDGTCLHPLKLMHLGGNSLLAYGSHQQGYAHTWRIETYFWRSDDAGTSWTSWTTPSFGDINNSDIWAVGSTGQQLLWNIGSVIYQSHDGGRNWSESLGPGAGYQSVTLALVQGGCVYAAQTPRRSPEVGKVSEDGGRSWRDLELPFNLPWGSALPMSLRAIGSNGLLIGELRMGVYVSGDAGATWQTALPPDTHLHPVRSLSVAWRDASNGLSINQKGDLSVTTDGGRTWQAKRSGLGGANGWGPDDDLSFVARRLQAHGMTIYLVGEDRRLYKSVDGGETWPGSLNLMTWRQVEFADAANGWGQRTEAAAFQVTRDGATTWRPVPAPSGTTRLWVAEGATMVAVGMQGLVATSTDEGQTWVTRSSGSTANLRRIYSRDAQTFWVVGDGGALLRSDDNAATWTAVTVPTTARLDDIQFVDAKNGWIVGDLGTVLATRDGGVTWTLQAAMTRRPLHRVQALDARSVWISGDESTLLATGTAGY